MYKRQEDEISDDASPALHSVRRTIRNINDKIHGAMNNLLNSSTTRSYLQDAVITMRTGRSCLPVKAEYKGQVPGMIHDQSSTGSTLFIEPMSVVKLNNDLKEAFLKEQEAIEAVLAELSNLTAQYLSLIHIYQVLQNKLYAIGREANKSVVAVRGIGEATDWFDNAYETESQGTGIIVADTGDEYLVVTEKKVISDASQVEVTFYNNDTASAVLQAYDENTGIALSLIHIC